MSWWVTDTLNSNNGPILLFSWVFWVILSITLHELGHGIAAVWQGDDTPIRSGHMTMNPLVHMGGYSLIVFAVIGIAWGAMPVNPYRFRMGRKGDALVSLAGPAVNLLLMFLTATTLGVVATYGSNGSFTDNLTNFLVMGSMLNGVLLILNLIPIPPLDGSRILAGISWSAENFYKKPEVQQFALLGLLLLLFTGGDLLFSTSMEITTWWSTTIAAILP